MSGDAPVTWSKKADDDQANAADALSAAAARLEMVGRGPMSPVKDPRPRDAPKSGNRRLRKPGGAGFDGTVVTEDGDTAEVPKHMESDVGGLAPFDNVPLEAPESEVPTRAFEKRLSIGAKGDDADMSDEEEESEEEPEPTEFRCPNVGCTSGTFDTKSKLATHERQCKCPAPPLVPVDDDAAAALNDFDTRSEAARRSNRRDRLVTKELGLYKPSSETKRWSSTKKLQELRKLIASDAKKLEKNDPVKPVVAYRADKGAGAQRYLCLGGRKQASKAPQLGFARKTGYTAGNPILCQLIGDVADGKVTNEFVGARWPTEGDWTDPSIIKVALDQSGRAAVSLEKIAQEQADDRAKHAAKMKATAADDAKQHQDWCRVALATPNVGAVWTRYMSRTKNKPYWHNAATGRSTWEDPSAFVKTPRVPLPPASDPEARKLAIAATYASRPRGRGLGDLISPDPEVRARAIAATTGDQTYGASRAPNVGALGN